MVNAREVGQANCTGEELVSSICRGPVWLTIPSDVWRNEVSMHTEIKKRIEQETEEQSRSGNSTEVVE